MPKLNECIIKSDDCEHPHHPTSDNMVVTTMGTVCFACFVSINLNRLMSQVNVKLEVRK